ncbi:lipopolysaccharide-induced tumor necrosis factor-alpha factor homolog [Contarinia nasturtii]|uniref:lipopolysaccharide-induced tumor necrosis factor-alpha factor homolog n=1 Tax=Contarinia nasturtii TaxID=265458 RepID=UPI0012D44344|nr:lipopolysaccharide-induced tumor necrosis factor-alpha factor homolog [Contarinia nasturtii]
MEHNTKVPETGAYPHPYPQQPPPQYTPNMQYSANLPPQYTPNPAQPAVITQQPVHVVHVHQTAPVVGPQPTMVVCANCHTNVLTRMEYEASTRTHLVALICCLFGLFPCAALPYCIESCQNGNHYCPACGAFVGTYVG